MAVRRGYGGDLFSGDFLPGGSPTVPPTARPTTPAQVAPNLFGPQAAGATATLNNPTRLPVTTPAPGVSTIYGAAANRAGDVTGTGTGAGTAPTATTAPTPAATTNTGTPGGNNPTMGYGWVGAQGQIAEAFARQGYEPTEALVGQWGSNIDDHYLATILAQIQSLPRGTWTPPGNTATGTGTGTGTGTSTGATSSDPRTAMSALFSHYGLDPNNPGHGLGNVQYFLDRLAATDPNDLPYWIGQDGLSGRLNAEIRAALFGEPNPYAEGGGGGSTGAPGNTGYDNTSALDTLLNSAIANILGAGGLSPSGGDIMAQLKALIAAGGTSPDITAQIVKARDNSVLAQQGMLADARGELAARGLLSEPGAPQGAEISAIGRIAQNIAPQFANALTDIQTHAMDIGSAQLTSALQMATGLSQDAAHNLVSTINAGTNRQTALANIALQTLDQNRQWQQFLMQYGLDRDKLANDIQNGNLDEVIKIIMAFINSGQVGAGGHI